MCVGGDPDFIALVRVLGRAGSRPLINDMVVADIGIRNMRMHVILSRPKWFAA
jgi:hypothetical protein